MEKNVQCLHGKDLFQTRQGRVDQVNAAMLLLLWLWLSLDSVLPFSGCSILGLPSLILKINCMCVFIDSFSWNLDIDEFVFSSFAPSRRFLDGAHTFSPRQT